MKKFIGLTMLAIPSCLLYIYFFEIIQATVIFVLCLMMAGVLMVWFAVATTLLKA